MCFNDTFFFLMYKNYLFKEILHGRQFCKEAHHLRLGLLDGTWTKKGWKPLSYELCFSSYQQNPKNVLSKKIKFNC